MSSASLDSRVARLTPKEVACLQLVARGLSSKEIASELGIAKTSVDTYCNRARGKLDVGGRHEAARLLRNVLTRDEDAGAAAIACVAPARVSAAGPARAPLTTATLTLLAMGVLATLAFGAMMAGFHALDAMKPPKFVSVQVTAAARASGP